MMAEVRCSAVLVLLLVLVPQLNTITNQHSRKKRAILPNQPRIITQAGHLVFQSGINHNIIFKTDAGGRFLMNNIDVVATVTQAESMKKAVDKLTASFGSGPDSVTSRLKSLEETAKDTSQTISNNYQQLSRNIASHNKDHKKIEDGFNSRLLKLEDQLQKMGTFKKDLEKKVDRLTNKVTTLETTVKTLTTTVHRQEKLLNKDECQSNPCLNGATCTDKYNDFTCKCPENFKGRYCSEDVDECHKFAGTTKGCQNGATCQNTPGSFSCQCTGNYHGVHCAEKHDACGNQATNNELCGHGTCQNLKSVNGQAKYKCICHPGWTTKSVSDPACSKDIDECHLKTIHCSKDPPVPCFNTPGSYHCGHCPAGYTGNGFICDDVNECQFNNGGCSLYPKVDCINSPGSSKCSPCPTGYQGDGRICTYDGACKFNNGGCHALAYCSEDGNGRRTGCTCPNTYVGSGEGPNGCVIRSKAMACSSNPCHNGGICEPVGTSKFRCYCTAGFNGPTCNRIVNACASNPCSNNGKCNAGAGGTFTCTCTSDFTGPTCQRRQSVCGGNENSESGFIEYPSFSKVYPNGASCIWVITTRSEKVLELVFQSFHVESFYQCNADFLEIYDGSSTSAMKVGKFCGSSLPNGGTIKSTSNYMYLWFKSNAEFQDTGFNVSWTSHYPSCGSHLNNSDSGKIQSPGYPDKYPPNQDCVWTVAVGIGKIIEFHIGHLALEVHKNCSFDFVEIRDGETEESKLLGKYCKSADVEGPLQTNGPYAFVRFHSDSAKTDNGFNIIYTTRIGCGGLYSTDSGHFQSPRVFKYPTCVWVIQTNRGSQVKLTFPSFDLESSSTCQKVFLVVRDGKDQTASSLGTFCNKDSPVELVAKENFMYIEFHSDGSMTGSGFQANWQTGCGGFFTGMYGEIVSPGWPGNYPSSVECLFKIIVPEFHTVVLNITNFHLEAHELCEKDYLMFYDGKDAKASVIKPKLCGPLLTRIVRSTRQYMAIKFHSDSTSTHLGFRATYRAKKSSGDPACGGPIADNGGGGGVVIRNADSFTVPGTLCDWVITVAPGSQIMLEFTEFHFPKFINKTCGAAGLSVQDIITRGKQTVRVSLGKFCYTNVEQISSFTSTENQMALTMTAQNDSMNQYFEASYTAFNISSDCSKDLRDASGVITSPNYPKSYPHNIHCVWTITVPKRHQIRLNVTDFEIQGHTNCKYDKLEIRNGLYSTSPIFKTYCGHNIFYEPIISHSNQLYINFVSDERGSGRGFSINYDSGATGCGADMSTPSGGFVSPNYPGEYLHNVDCIWTIKVSSGSQIILRFNAFNLQKHSSCIFDFLEIRENSQNGKSLGKYCGSKIPGPFNPTINKLWIRYKTDHSLGDTGFSAQYESNCCTHLSGHTGVIESPNYPEPYEHFSNCTWIITVPVGNKISISFVSFALQQGHDRLEVRDGRTAQDKVLLSADGDVVPGDIHSSLNSLRINFVSDASVAYGGFRLEWILDGCGGLMRDTTGTLKSPGYPNSYPHSLHCEWTIEVPLGKRIRLKITDFDVDMSSSCTKDVLQFYAGSDAKGQKISELCHKDKSKLGQVISTQGNTMFVRFISDSSQSGKGFVLDYTAEDGGCGGHFSAMWANILSPNYPNNYDNNLDCRWEIQVAEANTVELTFNSFAVQGNHFDHVTLYDGHTISSRNIAKLSGLQTPSPASYKSNKNTMLVRLVTDASGTHQGFSATYRTACGGTLNADVSGVIRSPNSGSELQECVWHISSKIHTRRVSLIFTSFHLQENCAKNYVSLADSLDPSVTEASEVQNSYCGSSLPPMYTSRSSILTVVLNVTTMENANFKATYSSADNVCGGNFSAQAGRFNSPEYPDMYPADTECYWQITTAPGNKLELTFRVFQFDPKGSSNDDYVEIYTPDLRGTCKGRWYANKRPPYLESRDGIWIKFRSNNDSSRGKGFKAQWKPAKSNALTGDHGEIGSPGWPEHPYENNANFRWTITVQEGFRVRITFKNFELQKKQGGVCNNDFLQIYDGLERNGISLGRQCGVQIPEPVTSVNNIVSIWFYTDKTMVLSGFLLSWDAILHNPALTPAPPPTKPSPTGCGKRFFATLAAKSFHYSLRLSSLFFGWSEKKCRWVFAVPDGHRVSVKFTHFDIGSYNKRCDSFVKVYDGSVKSRPLGTYCRGYKPKGTITSKSNYIILHLKTYYSGKFRLTYKQACGGEMSANSGVIRSPGYPNSYLPNLSCWWKITVPTDRTIQVTFNKPFSISGDSSNSCRGDYLQLFNGFDTSAPPLTASSSPKGRYCGTSAPSGVLETSSNILTVKFISDGSTSGKGFSFKFTERHFGCDSKLTLTNGLTSGTFTSPQYPKPYLQNVDCKWLIIAPATQRVQVDFEGKFNIQAHTDCLGDYLQFYDGGTFNSPKLGKPLCGTHLPSSVTSSGNVMLARFVTDKDTSHEGFKASYSIATCGGRIVGKQGFLTSPNFPSNYDPNLNCFWVLQGPVGHYLTIDITQMNLQKSAGCSADVLEIIDPASSTINSSIKIRNQETSVAFQGISVVEARVNASGGILYKDCEQLSKKPGGSSKSFQTADNRAYVWFKSDGSVSATGFKVKFEASVEKCGGYPSTSSGIIKSPNYPNLYAPRRVCIWDINVSPGRRIKLKFEDFFLDNSKGKDCKHDFVEVRNGIYPISPTLGRFCGAKAPNPVISSGHSMRVKFLTDHSVSSGGFKASYTSDEEAYCGSSLKQGSKRIISPGFSLTKGKNYGNNLQCVWKIHNTVYNSSIRLEFTHFYVRYDLGCVRDFVLIREGVDENGQLIGRFCGNPKTNPRKWLSLINKKPVIVIPTANAWIIFISDKSGSDKGFQLKYNFTDCGGEYTNENGVITSPNYPENYSNNVDCAWLIKAPIGMVIQVNFTDFQFENQSECTSDFLVLQNGGRYDSPHIGQYCNSPSIETVTSQSNKLRIVMSTDSKGTARGFRLEYTFSHLGCGRNFHKNTGSFSSPRYPSSYPHNTQCQWDITVEPGYYVALKFKPPFDVSCDDFVKVYDVTDDGSSKSLGSFCRKGNSVIPPVLTSSSSKMRVLFQSDADTNGNGFFAEYTSECGGSFNTTQASLMSPGYPGYRNNMHCKYTIDPGKDMMILINFIDFQLQDSHQCKSDYLRIFRGSDTKGKLILLECGDKVKKKNLQSMGPVFFEFKTDDSKTFRGYSIHYKSTECGGTFTSPSGVLDSSFFSGYYETSLNCIWLVTVDERKIIFFKFVKFSVGWTHKCKRDYLAIYDGKNLQAPIVRNTRKRMCGDINNWFKERRTTTGNHLLLNLVTGYSGRRNRGFQAVYTSSYAPSVGCGGTFTQKAGSFKSLDIDGDGFYEPDMECTWKITASSGKVVVLNITDFHIIGKLPDCKEDSLVIFDGELTHTIKKLCGKMDAPKIIRSTRRIMLVRFITDSTNSSSGFNATFQEEVASCGRILSAGDTSKDLKSPASLKTASRCMWTVVSKSSRYAVKIAVKKLNMGKDCSEEYLEIHDEPMGTHGRKSIACGKKKPPVFYSRLHKAAVIYHGSSSGVGFSLSYQRVGCSREYSSAAGRVTSPFYKQYYFRWGVCNVQIAASEGTYLSLYFEDFYIGFRWWSRKCSHKFTITSDGFKTGPLCFGKIPSPIFLSKKKAKITWSKELHGSIRFAVTFIASSKGKGCGGTITNAVPGVFTNPPKPPAGKELQCIWELNSWQNVRLKVERLKMTGTTGQLSGNRCAKSYLEIIRSDGHTYGKHCSARYSYEVTMKKGKVKYYVAANATAPIFKIKFYYEDQS